MGSYVQKPEESLPHVLSSSVAVISHDGVLRLHLSGSLFKLKLAHRRPYAQLEVASARITAPYIQERPAVNAVVSAAGSKSR